jgi:hypothetical protein
VLESTPALWPSLAEARQAAPAESELVEVVRRAYAPSLRPWPRDALQGFAMPEAVERFLTEHGLPQDPVLPLVRFVGPPIASRFRREGEQRLLVVGNDEGGELRMREGTAEITSIRPFRPDPARFVNSTVVHLLECLRLYTARREDLERADDEGAVNIAAELRVAVGAADARAVEHGKTWWSRVLEQVEAGFL